MPRIDLENLDGITPAIVLDNDTMQLEMGIDGNDSDLAKFSVQASAGATLGNPMIILDGSGNGDITLTPNGVGTIIASYMGDGVVQSDASGSLTSTQGTDGQVLIGSTGAAPDWASLTSTDGSVTFTPGANSLDLAAGGMVAITFDSDSGTATPSGGVIDIAGGTNIATTGAGNTITVNFDGILPVTSGGTGLATITDGGVMVGSGTGNVTPLAVGTDGQVLIGATSADPAFASLTSSGGSIVFTPGANTLNLESTGGTTTGLIQQVSNTLATVFSSNAVIPYDDTIPQNTEGDELLTVSITPTKSANKLYIYAAFLANGQTSLPTDCTIALFQDSTVDALTASAFNLNEGVNEEVSLVHIMDAGTTSSTTFKLRVGSASGGGIRINADSSATRLYGGVCKVTFYVQEISTGITTVPSAFPWTEVTTTPGPTSMDVNNGYIANAAGSVGLTLPAAADVGDTIKVTVKGAGAADIQQNAGQTIHFGTSSTTTGAGGTLTSTNQYDSIELLCTTTNTDFIVQDSVGNWTIV